MERVLLNDFQRLWALTRNDILAAVEEVGDSGWYVLGKRVGAFEARIAEISGRRHAVGCGNGLDAIEIALRALGLQPGSRVLTTPLSAFATTLAIVRAGGVPVFVDVDDHGLIDLDRCEDVLMNDRTIRFFVPVHLYGHPLDLERLRSLIPRFDLRVVEDCAQSIQAGIGSLLAGQVGQAATLSFYPTKNLGALGDGGAVLTDDLELRDAAAAIRDYGQTSKYVHQRLGMNSRLDEVQAAIMLRAFLPHLASWNSRRTAIAARYTEEIRSSAVRIVHSPAGRHSAWHLFPICVVKGARAAFQAHLGELGIQTAIHYPRVIPDQEAMGGIPHQVLGSLGEARRISDSEVSLPMNPFLRDDEVDRVIAAVNGWLP